MGFEVTGIDIDADRVEALNRAVSHIGDVEDDTLSALVTAGRYRATAAMECLANSDAIISCVPTPLRKTKDPDISFVLAAASEVKKYLRPGQLVILESTTYPGTTEELLLLMFTEDGLAVGKDFFLAFSPERIDPGNAQFRVRDIPKIVGGVTAHEGLCVERVDLKVEVVRQSDAVLILTDHQEFDYQLVVKTAELVVDTRNALRNLSVPKERIIWL